MMKTNFRTITSSLTFFLLFISLLLFQSCKTENRADPIPDSVRDFVYAYTTGIISKGTAIRVRFTDAVVTQELAGKEADAGFISFSPMVKGQAVWEDVNTLLFKPDDNFKSGTAYVATVALRDLFSNVPKEAGIFQFDFKTKEQGFTVNINRLSSEGADNLEKQELKGTLSTLDIADNEVVEKILAANQKGENLEIEWEHLSGREHQFLVKNIQREKVASTLDLSWNGSALDVDYVDERKIEIPALGDFKVLDAQVLRGGNVPSIQLNFSDPLLQNQNLEGLIRIQDFNGNLDFSIDNNQVFIYPKGNLSGEKVIEISAGIKNIQSDKMKKPSIWRVRIEEIKPQVRLVREGVIMPNAEGLILPFEAVSLNAVEVEVFKIFDNNILQFLQTNELNGSSDLYRVGKVVLQQKVPLKNLNPQATTFEWSNYALDLSQLFQADPNAIYQVRIGFRPQYTAYSCGRPEQEETQVLQASNVNSEEIQSFWGDWYGINGYYEAYRWEHREDPCQPAYYNYDRFVRTNVISSDLGIMAKGGTDKSFFVAITNLLSTDPIASAQVSFYDFQQQLIRTTTTDAAGIAEVILDRTPFAIIAETGLQKGYLKVGDGNSLSLSRYDVSGAIAQKGMKGYIYGERGVWRPGDSLFLNFILESKSKKLPENHPVTFELTDPRGQMVEKRILIDKIENVYPIHLKTDQNAITGNWMAAVKVGGAYFSRVLKIETVKPNRLKINLDFGKEELTIADIPSNVGLEVKWLHGAPAQNLEAKVEMEVVSKNTTFENYGHFEFDDPARNLYSRPMTIFDGVVNELGQVNFDINSFIQNNNAPGKVIAKIKSRAFEKGGDFSTYSTVIPYSPYKNYVGINLPIDNQKQKRIEVDKDGDIKFVVLDNHGNPLKNKQLDIGLYKVNWRWWWDRSSDNVSRFNNSNHNNAQRTASISTNNKGEATWTVKPDEWGRYLVRVCDPEGGHCSGDYFYSGYPWYNQEGKINRQEAAMMAFVADKEKYEVGQDIELKIPASEDSRILVTLENGTKVLDSFWGEVKKGENEIRLRATAAMVPTVYAYVSLIQPHGQVENDMPIRMYGVLPISVENPTTILIPQIKLPKELAPNQKFALKVSEENGEPMAYTIALVDDGLLDLTNYKTPNPHAAFYAREALGVRTWDVYDYVLGAYGGELDRVLSIGGDGELVANAEKKNANRFKPVVRHLGPFYLNKGKTATHEITLPNYVGSVRTMVVAANKESAYGYAEKTTPVRKPLMLLATLPRVLGPGEKLKMPVTLFAMDKKVKNVTLQVEESSGLVKLTKGNTQTISFSNPSEKMSYFDLEVGEGIGIAKFKITAKGGGETASQEIELDIRNPNPFVTNVESNWIEAGQNWEMEFEGVGMTGTNSGVLEVSNIPPINLEKRLKYLIRYPHGCVEQTTSAGFPQLFVGNLIELTEKQEFEITRNVEETINKLRRYQTAEGGFGYWAGNEDANAWCTNYVGHFLVEAKEKGYSLPIGMIENWTKFQRKRARVWQYDEGFGNSAHYNDLTQAYRLYTLSKVGEAEVGAMNRMREMSNLSLQANWRLAAAYALIGKQEVAKKIFTKLPTSVYPYQEMAYSYGSDMRDEAMILETLVLCGEADKGALILKNLSEKLSSNRWCSTQTTAYCLMAISKYIGKNVFDDKLTFDVKLGEKEIAHVGSKTPLMQIQVGVDRLKSKKVLVKNTSNGKLYARLILIGQPITGDQSAKEENLKLMVNYKAMNGIILDPKRIQQGTDFIAEVIISAPISRSINYDEMALTQIFPSGWEIMNTRMDGISGVLNTNTPEYQDIRDDRVYTYFDIHGNQSHVYQIQLNAAYQGMYYLPTVSCEAMYDNSINARVPGEWIEVIGAAEI